VTYFPPTYFDGATGILEQLVLAVVTQREANKQYQADGFTTDLVKDSVNLNVVNDNLAQE
jgi:hypothetical protein